MFYVTRVLSIPPSLNEIYEEISALVTTINLFASTLHALRAECKLLREIVI